MCGDGERIRVVSGAMFKGEEHLLVRNCIRWKLVLDAAIDRGRMQRALDAALEACPYLRLSVSNDERGLWYVPNLAPVSLLDEVPKRLGTTELGGHVFCLVCGERDLEAIVYHGLTDAAGLGWFLDALLNEYYGTADVLYRGVGTMDYACDSMASELELPEGYAPEPVMPKKRFAFPEAVEGQAPKHRLLSFRRDELKVFQAKCDCSTTAALVALLGASIMRVHPENQYPVCINSRVVLGMPHTFMNSSMPQVLVSIDPQQARVGNICAVASRCSDQIATQATRDHVAFFTNQVAAALRHERSEQMHAAFDTFQAPVVFSNLGTLTNDRAGAHVMASEMRAYGKSSIMANLSIVGDVCFLAFMQAFEATDYIDTLEAVMAEQGIKLSHVDPGTTDACQPARTDHNAVTCESEAAQGAAEGLEEQEHIC